MKCVTGKRCYESPKTARKAHRNSSKSWRLKVYFCPECRYFHTANLEKRGLCQEMRIKRYLRINSGATRKDDWGLSLEDYWSSELSEWTG